MKPCTKVRAVYTGGDPVAQIQGVHAMRKILIVLGALALLGGGVAVASSYCGADLPRDPARADCPGLIECPLTGEPICADQCPLRTNDASKPLPPCCRGK